MPHAHSWGRKMRTHRQPAGKIGRVQGWKYFLRESGKYFLQFNLFVAIKHCWIVYYLSLYVVAIMKNRYKLCFVKYLTLRNDAIFNPRCTCHALVYVKLFLGPAWYSTCRYIFSSLRSLFGHDNEKWLNLLRILNPFKSILGLWYKHQYFYLASVCVLFVNTHAGSRNAEGVIVLTFLSHLFVELFTQRWETPRD